MENHRSDATLLTQNLIRIDSTDPGAYEKNIAEYIFKQLSSLSVPVIKKEVLPGRYNIMAKIKGEIDDPALVYICHMDTVTIGDGWTTDPLGAEVINGRIYGRGACDMKSGLACALPAFPAMAEEAPSGRIPSHAYVYIG
ncbi:M20/M25/M40 family metallo-hydrolase, partial [Lacrimispora sp.]|uniref:M20/M25/M40 family metallo-hydrolase n=1 Tax=Lacrimispora sp. TaxID=2719234 RepID=UPI0028A603CB